MEPWYRQPNVWLLLALATVGTVVSTAGLAFAAIYTGADIPPVESLRLPDPTVVLDRDGEPVATLDPAAVREHVELSTLPEHVLQAHLAAEDRRFHEHRGFSPTAIVRAAVANVTSGTTVQGASTITQQYVELAVEDVDDTYVGKFREVAYAAKLESQTSKDRILEMYLNRVPYGRGAIGIQAAARTYFGIDAAELDVNQAATLAGIIAAPSAFSPVEHPDRAERRREYVLAGMREEGWLTAEEAERIGAAPLPELSDDPLVSFGKDAYFLDAVRDEVVAVLGAGRDPFLGLEIHTTLDSRAQAFAQDTLTRNLAETPYSGALVTIDHASGAVRALVGGLDYEQQQFNVAVEGLRQAGSAFKPVTLTAFVDEGRSPSSTVDAPAVLTLERGGEVDEVHNFTRRGYGTVTVHDATVRSINTAYVNLAERVGVADVVQMARRLGIERELPEVPSITLGTGGVTPLDMAEAYATLAAEGVDHQPYLIERIQTLDGGSAVHEHEPAEERAVEANVARVVTDVLQDVVRIGTGVAAALEEHPVAGKTGTTDEYRDAWFVGYTPQLTTAVWVGRLDNQPMERVTGGSLPAETWHEYMTEAMAVFEPGEFGEPDLSELEEDPEPSPLPTADPSPTPSPTPEPTPSPTPSPTASPTPEPTPTPTPTPTTDPSPSPTVTEDPSPSPTEDETTADPTETGSATRSPPGDDDGSSPSPSPSPTDEGSDP